MSADHTELLPDPLPAEPLAIVSEWLAQATAARTQPNPNSMVLATAGPDCRPAARVVLCKGIAPAPGYIVFYTNYLSSKGRQLEDNPRAAAVMHWDAFHRQVRVEGPITRVPESDSDRYFASRPWQSRIGAWASRQSEPIAAREQLLEAVRQTARRFGAPVPAAPGADDSLRITIPRPPHWGGYRLWAEAVELWVEGNARIHDRALWRRTVTVAPGDAVSTGAWVSTRLQP
jgi:pyridoxamine 5'-phosphate oxidase